MQRLLIVLRGIDVFQQAKRRIKLAEISDGNGLITDMLKQGLGLADALGQQAFNDWNAGSGITGEQGFPEETIVRRNRIPIGKARG